MSADVTHALLAGALAGLGVALPLGAIGVLLLQEGVAHGWRPAAAGATGVAVVDLAYAAVAVAAGTAIAQALAGHERAVGQVGAVVLLAVAGRGLWGVLRTRRTGQDSAAPPGPAGPAPSAGRVLLRFVALTAINPLTAVYFVVLTAGLGARLAGAEARAGFVAGVFAASLAWQLVLAGAGALAGTRLPAALRTATSVAGYLIVLGYAVRLGSGGAGTTAGKGSVRRSRNSGSGSWCLGPVTRRVRSGTPPPTAQRDRRSGTTSGAALLSSAQAVSATRCSPSGSSARSNSPGCPGVRLCRATVSDGRPGRRSRRAVAMEWPGAPVIVTWRWLPRGTRSADSWFAGTGWAAAPSRTRTRPTTDSCTRCAL